eukprot:2270126-Prymnesium_polylepis.1
MIDITDPKTDAGKRKRKAPPDVDEVLLHVVHLMCVAAHRRPRTRLPQSGGSVCDCLSARQSSQSSGMGM